MARDEELYRRALSEYGSGIVDRALLAKAYVLSEGNEDKARFEYIKLRVEQIKRDNLRDLPRRVREGISSAKEERKSRRENERTQLSLAKARKKEEREKRRRNIELGKRIEQRSKLALKSEVEERSGIALVDAFFGAMAVLVVLGLVVGFLFD